MHEEFPELTPEAMAACVAGNPSISYPNQGYRVRFAAFLREAIKQATDENGIVSVYQLQAIADNLHSPPSPPTQKQMEGILLDLSAAFGNQLGPEWTSDPFKELQRGIAHHCKGQP
jgi:hypothetical protein